MPRIKRWFPISRDFFSDPQYGELLESFGHEGFTLWAVFLKMAEDDEGVIVATSYKNMAASMASLARLTPDLAERALRTFIKWGWVNQEWYYSNFGSSNKLVFRCRNYAKYHPAQSIRTVPSTRQPPRAPAQKHPEGTERIGKHGYLEVVNSGRWVRVHHLIVEKALGKKIPEGCPVHHFNLIKTDNKPSNLVLCNDGSYHNLLHSRTYERYEIDSSGQFIRKSRESYFSQVGRPTVSLLPSDPSDPILIKNPDTPSADPVDKLEKADPGIKDELIKTAIRLAGASQKNQYKLCQWVLSMFSTLRREPRERIEAVVKLSLAALEAELTKGKPINDLWAYLTVIFDKERTKYMQGPENEAHKKAPLGSFGEILDKIAARAPSH